MQALYPDLCGQVTGTAVCICTLGKARMVRRAAVNEALDNHIIKCLHQLRHLNGAANAQCRMDQ
jgi:hypothetical protein